jgi:acyl-CoA thioesterase
MKRPFGTPGAYWLQLTIKCSAGTIPDDPKKLIMNINKDLTARSVVAHMMENDLFSQWLGITVIEVKEGYSKIKMTVRKEMINGFGIVHGGIAFSLSDSAFAFACNNRNVLSVALDTSINFIKPVHVDDVLIAEAKELHNGRSTGLYHITITNQNNHIVALFKGTCFRTNKTLV